MTQPERLFPDVARALVSLLEQFVDGPDHVGTETPDDLQVSMPFVRVLRVGGGDDTITDFPTVEVDSFASTSTEAERLAERIRDWLTARWRRTSDGVVIDRVFTESGPHERPWEDPRVRRWGATYNVECRRAPTSS